MELWSYGNNMDGYYLRLVQFTAENMIQKITDEPSFVVNFLITNFARFHFRIMNGIMHID